MSTEFFLTEPDKQRFTLVVTLPLAEWKKVSALLSTREGVVAYPLQRTIQDCVSEAEKSFWKSGREAAYQETQEGQQNG